MTAPFLPIRPGQIHILFKSPLNEFTARRTRLNKGFEIILSVVENGCCCLGLRGFGAR